METWRRVWRGGVAPSLSYRGLLALKKALLDDDSRLIQGATTTPPPLRCVWDWPTEAACAIAYCGWIGDKVSSTVGDVEEYFAKACFEIDQRLDQPAGCRYFLTWYDETPRAEMIRDLSQEVESSITDKELEGATLY